MCVTNKVNGGPFSRHLTLASYLSISWYMLGEGQLIRELNLGGVNYHGGNGLHARNHILHGDLPTAKVDNHPKPAFKIFLIPRDIF
jgi:hypothetical protein